MFQDFLPLVAKPGRYIDSELNVVRKDLSRVRTRVCLFFPDTYEVGMSHLGLRILYHILNGREDTACERVFSPWTDYEALLRKSGRPLTSIESNLPLAEFDIIGVTLQYELSYTNILTALDLGGIPVRRIDRKDGHPVVIAGGPCAVNPGPLSDFIDAFFIGEAEEAVHELVEARQQAKSRGKFLEALSGLEGFYVPASAKKSVRRRFIRELDRADYPSRPILPLMKPVHDRIAVEVARGCIRGCRFCQAGVIYRPYRERSPQVIKNLIQESLQCTGYEEVSLASLSAGDYSGIGELMRDLTGTYRDSRVSISLPSLRVGTLTDEMIKTIARVRKTGFTLAPEAGTERLRNVINKPVSELDLIDAAETIFSSGWNLIKLYFMLGLPTETREDLDGIMKLCHDLLALGRRASKRHVKLNVSVSTFVPKPHTPFQWLGQIPIEEVRAKQEYLSKGLRRRGIELKFHNPEMSLIEAAFTRGDPRIGGVIERAFRLGCRMDGWTEGFDFPKWNAAFRECGTDPASYACKSYAPGEPLPWDFVRTGMTDKFLENEYRRALSAEVTENCRVRCEACGIGCGDGGIASFGKASAPAAVAEAQAGVARPFVHELTARIRLKYSKTGRLRYLSHLDLMTLFQRAASASRIPLAFTRGFNPHPKMAFGPALSVGMESEAEYLDMETDPLIDLIETTKALNHILPEGIRLLESRIIPKNRPSLSGSIARYIYRVEIPQRYKDGVDGLVTDFLGQTSVLLERDGKQKDIRRAIEGIALTGDEKTKAIEITLQDKAEARARVQDVVEKLFGIGPEEAAMFRIKRIAVYCGDSGEWKSPMDIG